MLEISLPFWLFLTGLVFGCLMVVFGNMLPMAAAILQTLLPGANFGNIIGTIKFGGVFRGIGTLFSTYKTLDFSIIKWIWFPLAIGAIIGVNLIAHLDSKWIFPTLIIAYFIAEFANKIAPHISQKHLYGLAIIIGVYVGFLGAGLRSIFMSLLRLKFPDENKIVLLKIHSSFLSWTLVIIAATGHYLHGNITTEYATPFAAGAFLGGFTGGKILKKFAIKSPQSQRWLMRASFGLGILISGYLFFVQ